MWYLYNDNLIKNQAFTYSCLPCSLHMGLVNSGFLKSYPGEEDDSVEIYYREYIRVCEMKDISRQGASVDSLFRATYSYLQFKKYNKLFNFFDTRNGVNAISVSNLLGWNNKNYFAVIGNEDVCGHATLLIKTANTFMYIHTSTEIVNTYQSSLYGYNARIVAPNKSNEYSTICIYGLIDSENKESLIAAGSVCLLFEQ